MKVDPNLLRTGCVTYALRSIGSGEALHHITLAREKSLNALRPATFTALDAIIDEVKSPGYLLITALGRAFSAGGDVRELFRKIAKCSNSSTELRRVPAQETLNKEYQFMKRMASLREAGIVTVALADGYAFGAGQGLFQSCSVRLVTSNAVFSMPEVAIGLIPDCGASYFYARMPGYVGMYAALTGVRIKAADALALGLADAAVDGGWTGEGLPNVSRESALNDSMASLPGCSDLADAESTMRRSIDDIFCRESLADIMKGLRLKDGDWAAQAVSAMKSASPIALQECFRIMKMGYEGGTLSDAIDRELPVEVELAIGPDFQEGVRAVLIDKCGNPRFRAPRRPLFECE